MTKHALSHKREIVAERRATAQAMYSRKPKGATYQEIADALGLGHRSAARKLVLSKGAKDV